MRLLRTHVTTVLVAMVTAAVTAGGPALADGVRHALFAHDADKVDGKHAVAANTSVADRRGSLVATNRSGFLPNNIITKAPDANRVDGRHAVGAGTTRAARAGKLVATNKVGRLPNNIIAKAPNAAKLGGADPAAFASIGDSVFGSGVFIPTCSIGLQIASMPVVVVRQSRIFASAVVDYSAAGTNGTQAFYFLDLLDEGGVTVATAGHSRTNFASSVTSSAVVQGVLRAGTSTAGDTTPFVASPGSYTLRLRVTTSGTCGTTAESGHSPGRSLTYILTGTP